jgi:hypothetical protein
METPRNMAAQQRVKKSLLFGMGSIIITPPVIFIWAWISVQDAERIPTQYVMLLGLLILCIGMQVACVITAFPEPKNPSSSQGKTAVLLAVIVVSLLLPVSLGMLYFRIPFLNP